MNLWIYGSRCPRRGDLDPADVHGAGCCDRIREAEGVERSVAVFLAQSGRRLAVQGGPRSRENGWSVANLRASPASSELAVAEASGRFAAAMDSEFVEDVMHVILDGSVANLQRAPDLLIRHSLGEQIKHLVLPRR